MFKSWSVVVLAGVTAVSWWLAAEEPKPVTGGRDVAQKLFQDGNFNDAYQIYRRLAIDPQTEAVAVGEDLTQAVNCLSNLGRINEADALLEASIAAQPKNWRLLRAAAKNYQQIEHFGFLIAGEFERGGRRGQGKYVSAFERDRVRSLQLFHEALDLAKDDPAKSDLAQLCLEFASALQQGSVWGGDSWKLQVLTNWTQLPDYEESARRGRWGFGGNQSPGAPVDADGNPVFYYVPKSFAESQNDGQRWRWMLQQAVEYQADLKGQVDLQWAQFLHNQFGVQTMLGAGLAPQDEEGEMADKTGPFAVHTLKDNETIARLATGIKRFDLPEEFNPLLIFRALAEREQGSYAAVAADTVAQTYEDRRQFVKAAEAWKFALGKFGDENHRQQRLDQIVKNWGRFETVRVQPSGSGATVDFRFRNGKSVAFEAHAIKVGELLADVKKYLKDAPKQVNWEQINVSDIGYRLVVQNQSKYLGEKVAGWSLELKPRPDHADERVTVATPLQKAGAYLLTGQMQDGNVSRVIVWVADTTLVKKPLDNRNWFYVGDAVTGRPIAKANVEFFGWKQEPVRQNSNAYRVVTKNFAEFSDAGGQVTVDSNRLSHEFQWLITARTDEGRLAYLGFTGAWYGTYAEADYNQTKAFTITDRPAYRPDQTVKFKVWVGQAKYDQADDSPFAGQEFTVQIQTPQGEKVYEQKFKADRYGGIEGEYALPKGAQLGVYSLQIVNYGGGNFRVEEYKKPEFEVSVQAPTEPAMLGEKITATIQAKYYFGAPVTSGKVKYKVLRSFHNGNWYPPGRWDWFYGSGYWWFSGDYAWYPGWTRWGCYKPAPWWWGGAQPQPEVVAEREVEIGPDGTVSVEIDTMPAKELHGDHDHAYQITAEVTDESRRTIVGEGKVLVARRPFKVFAWVDKGHYRVGETIHAQFQAYTLDQKPVAGQGVLKLFRITYNDQAEPQETAAGSWDLETDAQGTASQQIAASQAGQYRLSYTLTDDKGHAIEGGYLFVVTGQGFDGREFRFNDIELITDKREYAPGDTVRVLINTNKPDGTVVLFLRPSNGIYLPPKVLALKGKSTVEEVGVVQKDMPNFFLEAFTIADGRYHEDVREVIVPPEQRVINVAVEPSETEYKPGQSAQVKVKLTGLDGKPFVGSTVLSVYDKSLEYISGGSNVPAIKEFFWKWRRNHHPRRECTLDQVFSNLLKQGEIAMNDLGAFGGTVWGGPVAGTPLGAPMMKSARSSGDRKDNANFFADGAALPAPAEAALSLDAGGAGGEEGIPLQQPTIRSNFADTAFWSANLITDADGYASVDFKMPENLTGWKVKARAMRPGTRVGEGAVEITTKKKSADSPRLPRFFVEDEVVLSANIRQLFVDEQACQSDSGTRRRRVGIAGSAGSNGSSRCERGSPR
ncbi:MAG: MG2 domain-containing protein [Planctomycetaceae bacterium]